MQRVLRIVCQVVMCAPMLLPSLVFSQGRGSDAGLIARRNAMEKELGSIAIIERKVMVPMRDGKRMQADILSAEG